MNTDYALNWNGHSSAFHSIVRDLYLEERLSDVSLFAEGKYFPGHKLVLCACSDYFKEVFDHCNTKDTGIILKDVSAQDLSSLLSFMYKGEVSVPGHYLKSFMVSAENLKIKGLTKNDRSNQSSNHEIENPDVSNMLPIIDEPLNAQEDAENCEDSDSHKEMGYADDDFIDNKKEFQIEDLSGIKNEDETFIYNACVNRSDETMLQVQYREESWTDHTDKGNWPEPINMEEVFPPSIKMALMNETPPNKRLVSLVLDSIYEYIKQYTYYPSTSQYHDLAHAFLQAFQYLEKYFDDSGRSPHIIWVAKFKEKFRNSRKRSDRYSIRPRHLKKIFHSPIEHNLTQSNSCGVPSIM